MLKKVYQCPNGLFLFFYALYEKMFQKYEGCINALMGFFYFSTVSFFSLHGYWLSVVLLCNNFQNIPKTSIWEQLFCLFFKSYQIVTKMLQMHPLAINTLYQGCTNSTALKIFKSQ